MTKHFFKVLTIFAMMIVLGLMGVFIVNSFNNGKPQDNKMADCKINHLC